MPASDRRHLPLTVLPENENTDFKNQQEVSFLVPSGIEAGEWGKKSLQYFRSVMEPSVFYHIY